MELWRGINNPIEHPLTAHFGRFVLECTLALKDLIHNTSSIAAACTFVNRIEGVYFPHVLLFHLNLVSLAKVQKTIAVNVCLLSCMQYL